MSITHSPRLPRTEWARIIITDLAGTVTTWLERSLLTASVNANLNQPWQITASVRSSV